MTKDESAVIEAAVGLFDLRRAAAYVPVSNDMMKQAEFALEMAVGKLHGEHDGRWQPR